MQMKSLDAVLNVSITAAAVAVSSSLLLLRTMGPSARRRACRRQLVVDGRLQTGKQSSSKEMEERYDAVSAEQDNGARSMEMLS